MLALWPISSLFPGFWPCSNLPLQHLALALISLEGIVSCSSICIPLECITSTLEWKTCKGQTSYRAQRYIPVRGEQEHLTREISSKWLLTATSPESSSSESASMSRKVNNVAQAVVTALSLLHYDRMWQMIANEQ